MTDTTSTDKTLRVGGRKPLGLKRDTDTVRQSFSGGRSKAVVVEKKRSRVATPGKRADVQAPVQEAPAEQAPQLPGPRRRAPGFESDQAAIRCGGSAQNSTSRLHTTQTMRASLFANATVALLWPHRSSTASAQRCSGPIGC